MGKIVLALLVSLMLVGKAASAFDTAARSAIVMDHRTEEVLFAKNAEELIPPASMSKLMTAFMVFEELKADRLKLTDTLPVSEKAWKTGGSKMFVHVGDRVSVEDLLRGMIIQSGNDACVVLAEAIAGSEGAMAQRMTKRAAEIGLTASRFKNVTGLDDADHKMSVRDLAVLASHIIREFPEYYKYYSEREFEYGSPKKIKQYNRNPLLQAGVPGVDGVKTGFTDDAGYGLVVSAVRDGRRVIAVLAGLDNVRLRKSESEQLLEHGFREFQEYRLFDKGQTVADGPVWLGAAPTVPLVPAETIGVTMRRELRKDLKVKLRYDAPIPAPIKAGDKVATLLVTVPGKPTREVPLVAGADVPQAGILGRLTSALGYLVFGGT